jgi:hypothetical protein
MSTPLARYAFLPWLRCGLAAKIKEEDNLNDFSNPPGGTWSEERPEFVIKAKIAGTKGSSSGNEVVPQTISLIGPGDVLGIDQNVVIKHDPANWVTNYEPNYFPYIEFYEEDFPWRYTPAKPAGEKLRPWMILIVLKESEFEREEGLTGPLPSIKVLQGAGASGAENPVWPDPSETWAWAHVHLSGDLDPTDSLDPNVSSDMSQALSRFVDMVADEPDRGVSRIICPRKLDPNTNYHAFLVPAFETGRLAGLGAEASEMSNVKAQEASFGSAHTQYEDRYPYYYQWYFKTGAAGDFESMVRRIVPRPADPKVGKRPMDVQEPGYNVSYPATPPFDGTLQLEGALMATSSREAYPWTGSTTYRDRLADLLNLSEDLMEATFPSGQFYGTNPFGYTGASQPIQDDPVITPDIYGRWHNLKKRVVTNYTSWIHELNLDPRNRAIAGLGAKYVRENQDDLMDKAWEQLGDVIEANRKLRWGQFSAQVANAGYIKHLVSQPEEQAMAMTGGVLKRIKMGSTTAYGKVKESALPKAMETAAFRKIQRPKGPVMKRLDPTNAVFTQNNLRVEVGNQNMAVVAPVAVSNQQSYMPANNAATYLNSVMSYSGTSTPIFGISQPGGNMVPNLNQQNAFQSAVMAYQGVFPANNWVTYQPAPPIDVAVAASNVVNELAPRVTIARRAYHNLSFTKPMVQPPADRIVPVMAYPVFQNVMYEAVKELGVDYFIPNLDLIPNNSITLLQNNRRFVESFLVGANHEMGRELLWREFPTDQRGSYFRQFWDAADKVNTGGQTEEDLADSMLDIEEIHLWNNSLLGANPAPNGFPGGNSLVLVIRGDLLKKYPNIVIYAQKAKYTGSPVDYDAERNLAPSIAANIKYPIFSAKVDPDVYFLAFELTETEARGNRDGSNPGWFFVLAERPGEIRFGVDIPDPNVNFVSWDDLAQDTANFVGENISINGGTTPVPSDTITGNVISGKVVNWGENSTNMAQILYQNPVMVCIHAHEMLPNP